MVYLDNILIYSSNLASHCKHVRDILQRLCANGLYFKPEKCEWHSETVTIGSFPSPCSFFAYRFPFIFIKSPLSPWTSISTDWFSCADYVVPLIHRFPSPSLLFYDDVSLRLGQALLGSCVLFPFYINPCTSCILSLTLTYLLLP